MVIRSLKQERSKSCGAACLRMILASYGIFLTEKEVIDATGGLRSCGTPTHLLAAHARRCGLSVRVYAFPQRPSLESVADALQEERCVMLTVDGTFGRSATAGSRRTFHTIIVTALTLNRATYIDPRDGRRHRVSLKKLCTAWELVAARAAAHTVIISDHSSIE